MQYLVVLKMTRDPYQQHSTEQINRGISHGMRVFICTYYEDLERLS